MDKIKSVYLAGPMRGYPEYNFPAFKDEAKRLRAEGYTVWSPAERDLLEGFDPQRDTPKPLSYYLAHDLPQVCQADAVVVLDGWEKSEGAMIEVSLAVSLGKPVYERLSNNFLAHIPLVDNDGLVSQEEYLATFKELTRKMLDITTAKNGDYARSNDAFKNFRLIEQLSPAIKVEDGILVRMSDKMTRIANLLHNEAKVADEKIEDTLLDLANYSLILIVWLRQKNERQ
jgi:nucleoside 2-deoxyribosyltransferase